jgi:hypothetical protein
LEGNNVNDKYSKGVCDLTDKEKVKRYEKALKDIVEMLINSTSLKLLK